MFLTGFADEAGSSIDVQIKATKELGWKYIETRNIDGKNLSTLTDAEFDEYTAKYPGGFGGALSKRIYLGYKITNGLRTFMQGRYGSDKLNTFLLIIGVITSVLSMLTAFFNPVSFVFTLISYFLMGWVIFRMLSRNTYKRYQENRKFLMIRDRLKDRQHRYFDCPKCRQSVRVPRGKGKIAITCPKCKEKFIRKT